MASGEEDIVQNIVLGGQSEVISAFASIQEAGTKAFEAIALASESESFGGLGLAIGGLIGSVTIITAGMFEWAHAASETTIQMANLATQGGSTIETMTALTVALSRAGASTDVLEGAFRRVAQRVANEWPQIQKEIRGAADSIQADNLAVLGSDLALERAQDNLADSTRKASLLRIGNILNVRSAQLSLQEAEDRANGVSNDPQIKEQQQFERDDLDLKQKQLALINARKKAEDDAADAARKAAEDQLKADEAQLKNNEAHRKQAEDSANDINNLKQFVENLANGVTDANLKVNVSSANLVKGLVASVGPGVEALHGFEGSIGDIGLAAPGLTPIMLKLADVFHNTGDEALKQALSVAVFGRFISQDLVTALSQGSKAIQEHIDHLKELGIVLTDIDKKVALDFHESFASLSTDVKIVGTQIGLLFAPVFVEGFKNLANLIEQNRVAILGWGSSIRDQVAPFVKDFFNFLSGKPVETKFAQDLTDAFRAIGVAAVIVKDIVIGAFRAISAILDPVAQAVNAVFGTELTGQTLAFGAAIVALLAKFTGLGAAIAAFSLVATASLGQVVLAIGLLITTAALAKQAFDVLWDDQRRKDFFTDMDAATDRTSERLKRLAEGFGILWDRVSGKINSEEASAAFKKLDQQVEDATKGNKSSSQDRLNNAFDQLGGGKATSTQEQALQTALNKFSADRQEELRKAADALKQGGQQSSDALKDSAKSLSSAADNINRSGEQAKSSFLSESETLRQQALADGFSVRSLADAHNNQFGGNQPPADTADNNFIGATKSIVNDIWGLLKQSVQPSQQLDQTDQPIGNLGIRGDAADQLDQSVTQVTDALVTLQPAIDQLASAAIDATQALLSVSSSSDSSGNVVTAAGGGFIVGPGTGTSDSIPLWGSNGEFMMNARAVSHWGLGVMHALNNMQMPRFSAGGLIGSLMDTLSPSMMPSMAGGGPVGGGGMHPVTFVIDGRQHSGFFAPSRVVETLGRESAIQQATSMGPKPRWDK